MPVSISNIVAKNKQQKEPPAKSVYDSLWGFYTFSQTVSYNYDEIGLTGLSEAIITINGFFTINAENSNSKSVSDSDSAACNKLLSKYGVLRKYLLSTINKSTPANVSEIGTEKDKRCIKIPSRLVDNNNQAIYAIPVSFATTEISPQILRYTVQLREPSKVSCKLNLNGRIINDATVSITCRRPRITYRTFAFASGSEAHITGIDNRRYSVSGDISEPYYTGNVVDFLIAPSNSYSTSGSSDSISSFGISKSVVDFIDGIIKKDKGIVKIRSSSDSNSSGVSMMITEHVVSNNFVNGSVHIEISGEESKSNSNS